MFRRVIGQELASRPRFLMQRANEELNATMPRGRWSENIAALYVRVFGIPEIGVYVRINKVLDCLPRELGRVVDLGCGPGMLFGAIHGRRAVRELVGVEIDPDAAQVARDTHPYALVVVGDVCRTDMSPLGFFDYAVSIDVLEHLSNDDVSRFVDAAYRLLHNGGCFIVHVPASPQRRHFRRFRHWEHHDHEREGFTPDDLKSTLESAGFRVVHQQGTFGWCGSLAWEANMILTGNPLQALAFPPLALLAESDSVVKSRRYNGVLSVAQKP